MGKLGAGWSRMVSSRSRNQLDTAPAQSELTKPVRNTKATEVEPPFVADVEYRDVTSEGLVRQKALPEIGQAVCCGRTTPSSQSCSLANANQLSDILLKRLRAG
jgi:ATP-dependent DNA ligase